MLEKIVKAFKENKHLKDLAEFLLPFGITNHAIKTIYQTYGNESIEILKENPCNIIKIKGISFKKADEIAIKIGMEFTIENYFRENGHICIDMETYFACAKEILDNENFQLSNVKFNEFIKELIGQEILRYANKWRKHITLTPYYNMEKYIFDTLRKYKNVHHGTIFSNIDEKIKQEENRAGFTLDEKQKDAVILTNSQYRVIFLEGYSGTGNQLQVNYQ